MATRSVALIWQGGTIQYTDLSDSGTLAEGALAPLADFTLTPGQLLEGANVLAVELHQVSTGSSDLGMDVVLSGVQPVGASSITLNDSALLKSRLLTSSGEWSALTEATFLVGALADASNLVVSEIFFQPAGASEALEFIELQNISAGSIELGGVQFTEGIDFTFTGGTELAAGGRILLVRNQAAFETEYGAGLPIAGEFQNATGLSNSGERIAILASDGSMIKDFAYDDALPWPTATDGLGYSLVLIDPASNPDHGAPTSWRSSVATGGNPGTTDTAPLVGTDLLSYAFGNDQTGGLTASISGSFVSLSYTHQLAADDVTITVQWSDDLITWTPLGIEFELTALTSVAGGRQQVSFTSLPTIFDPAFDRHRFWRLVVE